MKKRYKILIIGILFGLVLLVIPIREVVLNDEVKYGESFCDTYDGSCVQTLGHYTLEKLNLYQLIKYKGNYCDKELDNSCINLMIYGRDFKTNKEYFDYIKELKYAIENQGEQK